MRRTLALALMIAAATATNLFAGAEARLTGKVVDATTKAPVPGVTIKVVSAKGAARSFSQEFKVEKDGTYAIFLLDGTMKYDFTWSAAGYAPYMETFRLELGKPNLKDIELQPAQAAAPTQTGGAAKGEPDPAVVAYNAGAALANEGKLPEAIAKIEEAVTAKPDLTAGYQALARLYYRQKQYDKAIDRAGKVLALDADDTDMNGVMFESYTALGQKEKAAQYKAKLPANPGMLFNDAAKLINSNNDAAAEPLLKQAIAADDKFAPAYYELGMLYVRGGKSADAKTNLQKYIELDPNGKDVPTAKEMLKYVQ